jgi:hypothetical protein
MFTEVFAKMKMILGDGQRNILSVMNNLASALGSQAGLEETAVMKMESSSWIHTNKLNSFSVFKISDIP